MELLILSFIAGVLTIAAPCILPLLPVVVGGSVLGDKKPDPKKPYIITASLAVSVILFTLLLKATTALLGVSSMVWQSISGLIILLFGAYVLWPTWWSLLANKLKIDQQSNQLFARFYGKSGVSGSILTGFALGPVFNSCSPTYALIVASILPASFGRGLLYLLAYVVGLAGTLLVIALAGQSAVQRLGWLANPKGWFKRILGIILLIVGLSIVFGLDKKFQTFVLERGWYDPIAHLEDSFR